MAAESERAALVAAVGARLAALMNADTLATAASPELLDELVRLSAQIDPESDLEVAQTAGLLFFLRSIAVEDPDERGRCFVEALSLLRVVYRTGRGMFPDPVADVFRHSPDSSQPTGALRWWQTPGGWCAKALTTRWV